MKRVLWGGAVRLSYIYDAWCLKVKLDVKGILREGIDWIDLAYDWYK